MQCITIVTLIAMFQLQFAVDIGPNADLSGLGITVTLPNPASEVDTATNQWEAKVGEAVVEDWGIAVIFDAAIYGFHPTEESSIQITVYLECTNECDEFYAFGFGEDRFITFAQDADGGITMTGGKGGLFIYPADGSSSLGIGDPSGFVRDRTTNMRESDSLTGDNGPMTLWTTTPNGNNFPVIFTFTNDPPNNQFRVTFTQSVKFASGRTAIFNTAAPFLSDFKLFEGPDDTDTGSSHKISYSVTSINTGSIDPTKSPTEPPSVSECGEIGTFVWEDLMTSASGKPNAAATLSVVDATLTLNIEIEADYLGYSEADGNLGYGTTYVIDFEDFNAHGDNIKEPGTCQNRADVFGDASLTWSQVWAYSATPNEDGNVGSVNYLAYPPGNEWRVEMAADDVCTVKYSASFTWDELTRCTDYNDVNGPFISTSDNEDDITLSGTLYMNVVSPFSAAADFGFYRVYQLISQPFMIVVSKTVYVLGEVGINLLTMDIIAVYKEDQENTFRLVLMTESAEYLRLSRFNLGETSEYLQVFVADDAENEVTSGNFRMLETAETAQVDGGCLTNKGYICAQLWQITADNVQCTTDGIFTDFSGTYYIQFTPECRPEEEMPRDTAAERLQLSEYCERWLAEHEDEIIDTDAGDKVLLSAELSWKDEICDPEIFEVQFAAAMEFYIGGWTTAVPDSGYLYQVGEESIYVKVTAEYPSTHFDVFETELLNVWICTFDPLTPDEDIAIAVDSQTGGCFSTDRDDNSENFENEHIYELASGRALEGFVLDATDSLQSNEIQFKLDVPSTVARDTLYIHAQIEVSLTVGGGRRRRMILNVENTANQMEHFVDRVGITAGPGPSDDKYPFQEPQAPAPAPVYTGEPWVVSLQSPWVMAIGAVLAFMLTINIVFVCYTKWFGVRHSRYAPIKGTDSEFDGADSSERNAINVVSDRE